MEHVEVQVPKDSVIRGVAEGRDGYYLVVETEVQELPSSNRPARDYMKRKVVSIYERGESIRGLYLGTIMPYSFYLT